MPTDWHKNGGMCEKFDELHEEFLSILEDKDVENWHKYLKN